MTTDGDKVKTRQEAAQKAHNACAALSAVVDAAGRSQATATSLESALKVVDKTVADLGTALEATT